VDVAGAAVGGGGGVGVLVAGGAAGVFVAGNVDVAALICVSWAETVSAAAVEASSCGEGWRGKLHDARSAAAAIHASPKARRGRMLIVLLHPAPGNLRGRRRRGAMLPDAEDVKQATSCGKG
jgi:hypothetical protein